MNQDPTRLNKFLTSLGFRIGIVIGLVLLYDMKKYYNRDNYESFLKYQLEILDNGKDFEAKPVNKFGINLDKKSKELEDHLMEKILDKDIPKGKPSLIQEDLNEKLVRDRKR